MAQPNMDMPSWDCSPLADQNGRARTGLIKSDIARGIAATNGMDAIQEVTISNGTAEAIRCKLLEQKKRAAVAEEKVASQERMIQQLSNALAQVRFEDRKGVDGFCGELGQHRLPGRAEEKTLELAAVHLELHRAQQRLECRDSELDRILPGVVASRMQCSQQLSSKDAEIDRLRQELASSRTELAQLRPELRQAQQLVEHRDAEIDRLLPKVIASRMQGSQHLNNKDAEIDQVRRELDSAHAELALKDFELQQSCQDLEVKGSELNRIRAEMAASQQRLQCKDAEIDRLRLELNSGCAEWAQHRHGMERPRTDSLQSVITRPELDDFNQACHSMEHYLSQRSMDLERREQAIAGTRGIVAIFTSAQCTIA